MSAAPERPFVSPVTDEERRAARTLMRVGDPPRVVDGPDGAELEFAQCPKGCKGSPSGRHVVHRLREQGYPVPAYLLALERRGWRT